MIPQRQVGLEAPVCRFGIMGKTYHSVDHSTFSDFVYFAIPFHVFRILHSGPLKEVVSNPVKQKSLG